MKKFLFRTIVILLGIIIVPVAFFTIKQLTNLTDNEKIVKNVFDKQIETILYSLNQTSENIILNWVSKIDIPAELDQLITKQLLSGLLQNNPAVYKIQYIDLQKSKVELSMTAFNDTLSSFLPPESSIDSMKNLLNSGYQKVEGFRKDHYTILFFLLKNRGTDKGCVVYVETKTFIQQNLSSFFQTVAQDAFEIQVDDLREKRILFSTGSAESNLTGMHQQESWYLPGVVFYIKLRAATIDSLVMTRTKKDIFSIFIILIVVLAGVLFLIYSIRKEIRLSELKSEFVSNVSHELRTPLALISMYSETLLLKRFSNPEKEKEYLTVIFNETSRLTAIVNRILSFSRMEKMKRIYSFVEVDMNEIIDEVVYTFGPHLKTMNVDCIKDLETNLPLIQADREAVIECLVNLIDNAIKYGKPTDKKVHVKSYSDTKNVIIDVEDNGIGISSKHLPYIFDKFFRVTKGNLAQNSKGSGLGLNIVESVMKNHNGTVTVKSKLGEGSCFSIIFPKNKTND